MKSTLLFITFNILFFSCYGLLMDNNFCLTCCGPPPCCNCCGLNWLCDVKPILEVVPKKRQSLVDLINPITWPPTVCLMCCGPPPCCSTCGLGGIEESSNTFTIPPYILSKKSEN